jgi:hypothetical protein
MRATVVDATAISIDEIAAVVDELDLQEVPFGAVQRA